MDFLFRYKILVVDDRLDNLTSLSAVLKRAGYVNDTAISGREALGLLHKNKYGLIILDVQMPEMNGFEVAELIKGNSKTREIPLIFLSANATNGKFFNQGYAVGALDYLTKPVDTDLLLLKVKNFLLQYHYSELLHEANIRLTEKAAQAQISYECLYYSLPQDIFLINEDGIVVNINKVDKLTCGNVASVLINKHYTDSDFLTEIFAPLGSYSDFFKHIKRLKNNITTEFKYVKNNGEIYYGEAIMTYSYIGNSYHIQVSVNDITLKKRSEADLIESKTLMSSVLAALPEAIVIINEDGVITQWDKKSEVLFGWTESEVIGNSITKSIMPERYLEMFYSGLRYYLDTGKGELLNKTFETRALHKSGVELYVSLNVTASAINGKTHFVGFLRDISERKKSELLLFKSQQSYKTLLNNMNDGFVVDDIDGRITFANERFCEILGVNKIDLETMVMEDYVFPDDWMSVRERHFKRISGEFVSDYFECRAVKKNGDVIWIDVHVNPIYEKGVIKGTQSVIRDITKKKEIEKALVASEKKIRNFANYLNQVLEDERSDLAREIHDELGQQLTGIKFGLSSLKKSIGQNNWQTEQKISGLLADIDYSMQNLRKIATSLRPGILDTLGLPSSIEWLVKEYEKKNNIACKLKMDVDRQKFDKKISTCLFRICQESLTNISKHANASDIEVSLMLLKEKLVLEVRDNGIGISVNKQQNPFSMGLVGMRERVNNLGGHFEIISNTNNGTLIKTEVIIN